MYLPRLLLILACSTLPFVATAAEARGNRPCSGSKGGVSHCQGKLFTCKNGSSSQSKRSCSR